MVWYGMEWMDALLFHLIKLLYLELRGHGTKLNMDSNVLCLDAAAPATPTTGDLSITARSGPSDGIEGLSVFRISSHTVTHVQIMVGASIHPSIHTTSWLHPHNPMLQSNFLNDALLTLVHVYSPGNMHLLSF